MCLHTSIFIETPLAGSPAKAEEDASPHGIRLSHAGHNVVFASNGVILITIYIIVIIIIFNIFIIVFFLPHRLVLIIIIISLIWLFTLADLIPTFTHEASYNK